MKKVSFTEMKNGTKKDYIFLDKHEKNFASKTADRLLNFMSRLTETLEGYQISRLEHSLQSATRAYNNGETEEMIVAALLHDIGDGLAVFNHSQFAASILRPYVSEKVYWIVKHHGVFQNYYYAHHIGKDRNARDRYKDSPYYQATVDFCEKWDQASFDPNYESFPLEYFEPMVKRIFAKPIHDF